MTVCFQIRYFGTHGPLIGTLVSLEKRKYRLEVICAGTTYAERSFVFRLSHRILNCFHAWLCDRRNSFIRY